ncbi:hypothetical protein K525DRAFT_268736 [Schizophyllum commune Loenen D]|nr:hypothetical protein K525DRAFT_268736 [Schizophyllum commune Loenen D]
MSSVIQNTQLFLRQPNFPPSKVGVPVGLTPEVLIKKLQTRYDHGLHHRLIVEITDEVSPAVLKIAREINVAFRTVSDSLLEEVEDL